MKKKVLIIAYFFPPHNAIAAQRAGGLSKFLPEFGWDPTIITTRLPSPPEPGLHVVETEGSDILLEWKRRLRFPVDKTFRENLRQTGEKETPVDLFLNSAREILAYPDYNKGWYSQVMPVARRLLEGGEYDAIISTAGPYTAHRIACSLKKEYGIPWVADFRDLWTQNHHYSFGRVRTFFEKRLEIRTLSDADAITTVSSPLAAKLATLHRSPVHVVTHGFDPGILNPDNSPEPGFSIHYTGRIYRGKMDPEPFFRMVRNALDRSLVGAGDIRIHFWGSFEPWLGDLIRSYSLDTIVRLHDQVPRDKAIGIQRSAQVLLLLAWNDPQEDGVLTGKVFEYLAARRPILAMGSSGKGIAALLEETQAGTFAHNDEELETMFLRYYRQYTTGGYVLYSGRDTAVNALSHRNMAGQFASLLDSICAGRRDKNLRQAGSFSDMTAKNRNHQ